MKYLILLLLALGAPKATATEGLIYPAHVIRVIDGDTFWAWIEPMPDLQVKRAIRLDGIDAPEIRGKCDSERALAQRAKARLTALLNGKVTVEGSHPGKYAQRLIARVRVDGRDIASILLDEGLVQPMRGGRRLAWCG
ncbi:hypothetical protein JCM17960_29470 [Magnetospira thiophila]